MRLGSRRDGAGRGRVGAHPRPRSFGEKGAPPGPRTGSRHDQAMILAEPWQLGSRSVRNRVVFGPHETNLGDGRAFSSRHLAYYRRRAGGGAGMIVLEEASVD